MRKGIRGLQNIQLLKWCQELGIWPLWLMIWGFPGESPEEYRRVAGMIPLLSHLPPPRAEMTIRLDRFSPNYESRDDLGFSNVRPAQAYGHVYPFPPGVLNNLAYFFDYDYQAPRDVGAYTRELKELIRHWREAYPRSGLYCEDRGDALWVWDFRDVAARELTILSGVESVLYRACDEVRGMTSLRKYADAERVEEIVRRLVDLRLVLREADSVLSLAVRAPAAGSLGWDANPQPGSSAERRRKL
jgi:hypothetical protein